MSFARQKKWDNDELLVIILWKDQQLQKKTLWRQHELKKKKDKGKVGMRSHPHLFEACPMEKGGLVCHDIFWTHYNENAQFNLCFVWNRR